MTKGDLEVNRVEQSALPATAMVTAPVASKSSVMVEKNSRGFRSHYKERTGVAKLRGLSYHENVCLIHHTVCESSPFIIK